jgi:uncharacterized protein
MNFCDSGDMSLHQDVAVPPLKNMTVPRGVPEGDDTASSPPAFSDTFGQFEIPNRWHCEPEGQSVTPPGNRVNVPSGQGRDAPACTAPLGSVNASAIRLSTNDRTTRHIRVPIMVEPHGSEGPMRIVILSDTHIPDFATRLPGELFPRLRRAELIIHAGDVSSSEVLTELAQYAPVMAALGNKDGPEVLAWGARPESTFDIEGVVTALVHDSGPRTGRERRLTRRFPSARLIVFGHSHIPIDTDVDGVRFLNPGSPTWKRRQPAPTFATATIHEGRIRTRLVEL